MLFLCLCLHISLTSRLLLTSLLPLSLSLSRSLSLISSLTLSLLPILISCSSSLLCLVSHSHFYFLFSLYTWGEDAPGIKQTNCRPDKGRCPPEQTGILEFCFFDLYIKKTAFSTTKQHPSRDVCKLIDEVHPKTPALHPNHSGRCARSSCRSKASAESQVAGTGAFRP